MTAGGVHIPGVAIRAHPRTWPELRVKYAHREAV